MGVQGFATTATFDGNNANQPCNDFVTKFNKELQGNMTVAKRDSEANGDTVCTYKTKQGVAIKVRDGNQGLKSLTGTIVCGFIGQKLDVTNPTKVIPSATPDNITHCSVGVKDTDVIITFYWRNGDPTGECSQLSAGNVGGLFQMGSVTKDDIGQAGAQLVCRQDIKSADNYVEVYASINRSVAQDICVDIQKGLSR